MSTNPEFQSPSDLDTIDTLVGSYQTDELQPLAVRRDLSSRLADGEISDEQAEEILYRLGMLNTPVES